VAVEGTPVDGGRRRGKALELAVIAAAASAIPVIVVDEANLGAPWEPVAHGLGWVIWAVFATEVVVMLAQAVDRRAWVRSHLVDVMIVVLTRPFLPESLQPARLLWVLRILRLLHGVDRVNERVRRVGRAAGGAGLRAAGALSTLAPRERPDQPRRPTANPVTRAAATATLAPVWAAGTVLGILRATLRAFGDASARAARPPAPERLGKHGDGVGLHLFDRQVPQRLEREAHLLEIGRARVTRGEVLFEAHPLGGWHDVLEVRRYELDDLAAGQPGGPGATAPE
jgi:hypothetical protein